MRALQYCCVFSTDEKTDREMDFFFFFVRLIGGRFQELFTEDEMVLVTNSQRTYGQEG